jgi:transposase
VSAAITQTLAARRGFPDYAYYHRVASRPGNRKNPTLAVERKLLRRCYHTLRALGDAALAPPVADAKEVAA